MLNRRKKKCEKDGATVTEKKIRTAPTNTSLLPPCKVCQEPAAGFHYGANTCEACKVCSMKPNDKCQREAGRCITCRKLFEKNPLKSEWDRPCGEGFFRRTLLRKGDYACINGDEKCDVAQAMKRGRKRICPRCRHLKCIAVGMSLEAVKTGRYTHTKRTKDILEYQETMRLSNNSACLSPSQDAISLNAAVHHGYTASAVTSHADRSASRNTMSDSPHLVAALAAAQKGNIIPPAPVPLSLTSPEIYQQSEGPPPVHPKSDSSHTFSASEEIASDSPTCLNIDSGAILSSLDATDFSPLTCPQMSTLALMDNIVDQSLGYEEMFTGRHRDNSSSVASSDLNVLTPCTLSSEECSPLNTNIVNDYMTDEECRSLTSHLLHSHDKFSSGCLKDPDKILESQNQCYENYQAHIEAFGYMGELSLEEYNDIYETTGIDVDGRQDFINILSMMMEENIRRLIDFIKTIPGFSQLSIKDQIKLIKGSRCEMGMVCQAEGYNEELKVMTLPSGGSFCVHELNKFCGKELTDTRTHCILAVQKLGLCHDELVLFSLIVLISEGRYDVEEPEKVSAIQWRIVQCLLWLLKENKHPNPHMTFAHMISVFMLLRERSESFYVWLQSEPFSHYGQLKNNKLLAEWFSNS